MCSILLAVYMLCFAFSALFWATELYLTYCYLRAVQYNAGVLLPILPLSAVPELCPFVTVQLPIYNEQYVAERIIDAVAAFDYPKSRFEIQVLDDSTDRTIFLSQAKVAYYTAQGITISLLHRTDRQGYKAGALQAALPLAQGDIVALFDADFVPQPDFLRRIVPHFAAPDIGAVQGRWLHLNRHSNLLTQIQALLIDLHFTVEQLGRSAGGFFLNFNGTAGAWRRKTIEQSGGWQADTLTEDLDLSYRAQLNGWRIAYIEPLGVAAELPADLSGFKSQQHRWIKGGAETARKLLPAIIKAKLPWLVKLNAVVHLCSGSFYIAIFLSSLLSFPVMLLCASEAFIEKIIVNLFFCALTAVLLIVYFVVLHNQYYQATKHINWLSAIWVLPALLAMTVGMSYHNARAAWQGWRGMASGFVRTPKFKLNDYDNADANTAKHYRNPLTGKQLIIEILLLCYFITVIVGSIWAHQEETLFSSIFASMGYGLVVYYSLYEIKKKS